MLSDRFEFVQGYDSNSASDTDIWEAVDKATGKPVILKVFLRSLSVLSEGTPIHYVSSDWGTRALLAHETSTYHSLRELLILPYNVRNIICAIGEGTFDTAEAVRFLTRGRRGLPPGRAQLNLLHSSAFMMRNEPSLAKSVRVSQADRRPSISTPWLKTNVDIKVIPDYVRDYLLEKTPSAVTPQFLESMEYGCLITPKIARITFEQMFDETANLGLLSSGYLANYLFILFCTIWAMSSSGINQSDLHWNNILLDDAYFGPSSLHLRKYFIVFDETLVFIDNAYCLFVFDFDRATVREQSIYALEHPENRWFTSYSCKTFHPKRDFFKQICTVKLKVDQLGSDETKELASGLFYLLGRDIRAWIKELRNCSLHSGRPREVAAVCDADLLNDNVPEPFVLTAYMLQKTTFPKIPLDRIRDPKFAKTFQEFRLQIPPSASREEIRNYVKVNVQFLCRKHKFGAWQREANSEAMDDVLDQIAYAVSTVPFSKKDGRPTLKRQGAQHTLV